MTGSYMDHWNKKLDITVEDEGLPDVIRFVAKAMVGRDVNGQDPFARKDKRLCLTYRLSSDRTAVYIGHDVEGDIEEGWAAVRGRGLAARDMAAVIRAALRDVPRPRSDCDGITAPGWRVMDARAMALANEDHLEDAEDLEYAIACVQPYTCEFPK